MFFSLARNPILSIVHSTGSPNFLVITQNQNSKQNQIQHNWQYSKHSSFALYISRYAVFWLLLPVAPDVGWKRLCWKGNSRLVLNINTTEFSYWVDCFVCWFYFYSQLLLYVLKINIYFRYKKINRLFEETFLIFLIVNNMNFCISTWDWELPNIMNPVLALHLLFYVTQLMDHSEALTILAPLGCDSLFFFLILFF